MTAALPRAVALLSMTTTTANTKRNDNNGRGWYQAEQFSDGTWYVAHTAHQFDDKGRPNFDNRAEAEAAATYLALSGYGR